MSDGTADWNGATHSPLYPYSDKNSYGKSTFVKTIDVDYNDPCLNVAAIEAAQQNIFSASFQRSYSVLRNVSMECSSVMDKQQAGVNVAEAPAIDAECRSRDSVYSMIQSLYLSLDNVSAGIDAKTATMASFSEVIAVVIREILTNSGPLAHAFFSATNVKTAAEANSLTIAFEALAKVLLASNPGAVDDDDKEEFEKETDNALKSGITAPKEAFVPGRTSSSTWNVAKVKRLMMAFFVIEEVARSDEEGNEVVADEVDEGVWVLQTFYNRRKSTSLVGATLEIFCSTYCSTVRQREEEGEEKGGGEVEKDEDVDMVPVGADSKKTTPPLAPTKEAGVASVPSSSSPPEVRGWLLRDGVLYQSEATTNKDDATAKVSAMAHPNAISPLWARLPVEALEKKIFGSSLDGSPFKGVVFKVLKRLQESADQIGAPLLTVTKKQFVPAVEVGPSGKGKKKRVLSTSIISLLASLAVLAKKVSSKTLENDLGADGEDKSSSAPNAAQEASDAAGEVGGGVGGGEDDDDAEAAVEVQATGALDTVGDDDQEATNVSSNDLLKASKLKSELKRFESLADTVFCSNVVSFCRVQEKKSRTKKTNDGTTTPVVAEVANCAVDAYDTTKSLYLVGVNFPWGEGFFSDYVLTTQVMSQLLESLRSSVKSFDCKKKRPQVGASKKSRLVFLAKYDKLLVFQTRTQPAFNIKKVASPAAEKPPSSESESESDSEGENETDDRDALHVKVIPASSKDSASFFDEDVFLSNLDGALTVTNTSYARLHGVHFTQVTVTPEVTGVRGLHESPLKTKGSPLFVPLPPRSTITLIGSKLIVGGDIKYSSVLKNTEEEGGNATPCSLEKKMSPTSLQVQLTFDYKSLDGWNDARSIGVGDEWFRVERSVSPPVTKKRRPPKENKNSIRNFISAPPSTNKVEVVDDDEDTTTSMGDVECNVASAAASPSVPNEAPVVVVVSTKVNAANVHKLGAFIEDYVTKRNIPIGDVSADEAKARKFLQGEMGRVVKKYFPDRVDVVVADKPSEVELFAAFEKGAEVLIVKHLKLKLAREVSRCAKSFKIAKHQGDENASYADFSPQNDDYAKWRPMSLAEQRYFLGHRRFYLASSMVRVRYMTPHEVLTKSANGENVLTPDAWKTYTERWDALMACRMAATDPGVRVLYSIYDPGKCLYIQLGAGFCAYKYNVFDVKLDDKRREIAVLEKNFADASALKSASGNAACVRIATSLTKIGRQAQHLQDSANRAVVLMEDICFSVLSKYDHLLLPKFSKATMLQKMGPYTSRNLMGFGHARVRDKLLKFAKVSTLLGRSVRIVGEEFSTKCCPGCSCYNRTIGGRKAHQCRGDCNDDGGRAFWDRDCGSARSIFVRYFHEYVEVRPPVEQVSTKGSNAGGQERTTAGEGSSRGGEKRTSGSANAAGANLGTNNSNPGGVDNASTTAAASDGNNNNNKTKPTGATTSRDGGSKPLRGVTVNNKQYRTEWEFKQFENPTLRQSLEAQRPLNI